MTHDEAAKVLRAYNGWRVDDPAYPDMPNPIEITQALDLAIDALRDAERYRWLRERDLGTISHGGVFAGMTPKNVVLNGDDLDEAIDCALLARREQSK